MVEARRIELLAAPFLHNFNNIKNLKYRAFRVFGVTHVTKDYNGIVPYIVPKTDQAKSIIMIKMIRGPCRGGRPGSSKANEIHYHVYDLIIT